MILRFGRDDEVEEDEMVDDEVGDDEVEEEAVEKDFSYINKIFNYYFSIINRS